MKNPDAEQAAADLTAAFKEATRQKATLLVALMGHGKATDDEFYFMTRDAPQEPTPTSALPVVSLVRDLLPHSDDLDGLILLVDACEAGRVVREMGHQWINVLGQRRGRMDLLVASADGAAYDACFTRQILDMFETGLDRCGDGLVCADLHPTITSKCNSQIPIQQSYSNAVVTRGDRSLTLVRNPKREDDALYNRPGAGLVDQLTAPGALVVTPQMWRALQQLRQTITGSPGPARLHVVSGPAGCGKSTLLALMVRPGANEQLTEVLSYNSQTVKAAVFLDSTSTPDSFAAEVAAQLGRTVKAIPILKKPPFDEASVQVNKALDPDARARLSIWERTVVMPLAKLEPEQPVPIIVDGLDRPESGAGKAIANDLTKLVTATGCEQVRVIAGVRSGAMADYLAGLHPDSSRMELAAPSNDEIADALRRQLTEVLRRQRRSRTIELDVDQIAGVLASDPEGGWLLARLLADLTERTYATADPRDLPPSWLNDQCGIDELISQRINLALDDSVGEPLLTGRILVLCAAAGVGPLLPVRLIHAALAPEISADLFLPRIRNCLPALGALLTRGQPGTDEETLGLAHDLYQAPIERQLNATDNSLTWAHGKIINSASAITGSTADSISPHSAEAYWRRAAPHHYFAVGEREKAFSHLLAGDDDDGGLPAVNRDRWASWIDAFTHSLTEEDEGTLAARSRLAYWTGRAGDPERAKAEFVQLVRTLTKVLGPSEPNTVITRGYLASCRGELGEIDGAITDYRSLLADLPQLPDDRRPADLEHRNNLANWQLQTAELAGAVETLREVLEEAAGKYRPTEPFLFRVRSNLIRAQAVAGFLTPSEAAIQFQRLLDEQTSTQHGDSPDVLLTRHNLANYRGHAGHFAEAIEDLQLLRCDRERLLGKNNRDTLQTRSDLAFFRGLAGQLTEATAEFDELLAIRRQFLRHEHPDVLTTRRNLARFHGEAGRPASAVEESRALLDAHHRVHGPTGRATLLNRANLARFQGEAGDFAHAVHALKQLVSDQLEVLTADHPDVLTNRYFMARFWAEADDPTRAVGDLERLEADQQRVLGAEHPDSGRTRETLARLQTSLR